MHSQSEITATLELSYLTATRFWWLCHFSDLFKVSGASPSGVQVGNQENLGKGSG